MTENAPSANRQIARAAGTVAFALIIGQLAGLASRILVAHAFGTSVELDAFYAANRVAETLFLLVAGGALGSSFIPTFTGFLVKNDEKSAWELAAGVANLVTLVLVVLSALAALFAPQIVRYALAPGLAADPALFALTIKLMRIQIVTAVFFGLGGLLVGILNARRVFLVPALMPAAYQLGWIIGVLILVPYYGIFGLAWGVVLGSVLYLIFQIPVLLKQKGTFTFTLGLNNPAVREVMKLMAPRLFGVAIVQLNFWVNIALASQMTEGSVSAVTYGFNLMLMAQAAIAQSVATAAMPTLAAQYALGKMDEIRSTSASSLRGVMFLALPASLGLILLRKPIIAMLFQRGSFDDNSTEMVAWALLLYAAGLVFHAMLEILARAFYALKDTKTPVFVGAAAMALNVGLSFAFVAMFKSLGWMPHGGLALANTTATALEAITLFALMRRRLGGIHGATLARGFGAAALVTLGMSLALVLWNQATGGMNRWLVALGGIAVGGLVYALGVILLKVPEIQSIAGFVKRRLGR